MVEKICGTRKRFVCVHVCVFCVFRFTSVKLDHSPSVIMCPLSIPILIDWSSSELCASSLQPTTGRDGNLITFQRIWSYDHALLKFYYYYYYYCCCICRRAFDEAVKQLSRICDPNISQMLGVIRQREPIAIVMEYLSHGDLHQFLQQRVFDDRPTSDRTHRNGPPSLRWSFEVFPRHATVAMYPAYRSVILASVTLQ